MPVLLVRHAHAGSRKDWSGSDQLRPLTDKGRRQAEALVRMLDGWGISAIMSSPYVRCMQTMEPLAVKYGLAVEPRDELAEEQAGSASTLELVRSLTGSTVVLCTHGDIIPEILVALADEDRVELGSNPRQAKGSVWILEGSDGVFESATYLPPGE